MSYHYKVATIFGGTGFIGSQIVRELARRGYTIKVATRVPERAYFLRPNGVVGQIVPFYCDYSDEKSVQKAVQGADVVVNTIGILYEKKHGSFKRAHIAIPEAIAKACKKESVKRFIHVSSLGVYGHSRYGITKKQGEDAVMKAFPHATIFRPSIVFGPEDSFFNKFAEMARYLPCLPLIGGGKTKFQPVYVGDIADAAMAVIDAPDNGEASACGRVYELGGPEIASFRDLYEMIFKYTHRKRALVPLPYFIAKIQAFFMGLLPAPPLTIDQVDSLKSDNIVTDGALTLEDLGIRATGMEQIVPYYLARFRAGGRFADKKRA